MSHQQLASLWSTLNEIQDATVMIRDATGHYVLNSILSQHDAGAQAQSFLIYAIELSTTFDLIRISNSKSLTPTTFKSVDISSAPICAVLAHLLQSVPTEVFTSLSGISRTSFIARTLTRAIVSAMCTLVSVTQDQQSEQAEYLATAARDLIAKLPAHQGQFEHLRHLCTYLGHNFLPEKVSKLRIDMATFARNQHSRDEKSTAIKQLVNIATLPHEDIDKKSAAIIQLCYIFWEADSILVQCCHASRQPQNDQGPLFYSRETTADTEARLFVQEYLAVADSTSSESSELRYFDAFSLLTPGLGRSCTMGFCECTTAQNEPETSLDLRTPPSRQALLDLEGAYHTYYKLARTSLRHASNIFVNFHQRLSKPRGAPTAYPDPIITTCGASQISSPSSSMSQRGQSARVYRKLDKLPPLSLTPHSPNQSTASTPYSRSYMGPANGSYFGSIVKAASEGAYPHSPPALSPGGGHSSSQQSRTDSIPTIDSTSYTTGNTGNGVQLHQNNTARAFDQYDKFLVHRLPGQNVNPLQSLDADLPEVVGPNGFDSLSLMSDNSASPTVVNAKKSLQRGRFGNLLRGKKDSSTDFVVPTFRFSASGKHILLWTKNGGGFLDPNKRVGWEFSPVIEQGIVHAAAGTQCYVFVSHASEGYKISVYRLDKPEKIDEWNIPRRPSAIDVSRNDKYLAVKFTRLVRLYSIDQKGGSGQSYNDHDLKIHEDNRAGSGNHLVSFAHDSQSFVASTRFEPEKVFTYWSSCVRSQPTVTVHSNAPFRLPDDHGLSSLLVCGHSSTHSPNAFLSTFTERGSPVTLAMASPGPMPRLIRDAKDQIGTRIQSAAMYVHPTTSKSSIVLINQNQQVFWITDVFGREPKAERVATMKRPRSLKPEIQIGMSDAEEASIFHVDEKSQKGILTLINKRGDMSTRGEYKLNVEPMCAS